MRKISQTITIIVLSLHEDDAHILAAMRAGASAYVFKSEPITALMSALKHGLDSPLKFSVKGLYEIVARQKDVFELSTRELEVIALLPSGKTTRELASSLYISEATVKSHLASIFRKLHVKNKLAAVLKAREAGLY